MIFKPHSLPIHYSLFNNHDYMWLLRSLSSEREHCHFSCAPLTEKETPLNKNNGLVFKINKFFEFIIIMRGYQIKLFTPYMYNFCQPRARSKMGVTSILNEVRVCTEVMYIPVVATLSI